MFKKLLEYIKYKIAIKELEKNYFSIYRIYKGVRLCDPVSIYRKGNKIVQHEYLNFDKYLKRPVIDGIEAAIAGTSAINLFFMDKDDKMKPFIKKLYRSKLNGAPELILDYV